ncbi:MAG: ATP-binding cassette domain-containing protein [Ideonella sp.]|nr:ATP-binding cassette domain-containing protein [Ideonella sp.]
MSDLVREAARPLTHGASASPVAAVAGTALLRLNAASVRFGDVQALRPVTLTLYRGDRLALVGANGSGKTTLLRLLNGQISPSSGERSLAGHGRPPVSAMLFQRPFLLNLSVRRNLQLAFWLAGVPAAERVARLPLALDRVGLQALADRPARSLSGGQQQRLALARAWGVRPDILFLDEPTASLDPSAKREVEALIEEFARDGMTLVMSSHNLGQVKRLASRVVHLDAGRLVVDLPTEPFFNHDALPPEAAQFLKGELPWT